MLRYPRFIPCACKNVILQNNKKLRLLLRFAFVLHYLCKTKLSLEKIDYK